MSEWHGDAHGAVDLSANAAAAKQNGSTASTQSPSAQLIVDAGDADFDSVLQLSTTVPVIVDLWATWCEPCKQLSPILEKLITEYAGRLVLARVDVDANPQLAQAFRAQSIPMVLALIGGQPYPLFSGALPEAQVQQALEQVLQAAAQAGVTGTIDAAPPAPDTEAAAEPAEPELSPEESAAFAAIEKGDYAEARAIFERALVEKPTDETLQAGLANAALLERTASPATEATGVAAVLGQADYLISSQHAQAAFDTLLAAFTNADDRDREAIRERLLDYFLILGAHDPAVSAARSRLASLLY